MMIATVEVARELPGRRVPTIIISASPAATESVRPPRGMTWDGIAIGKIMGNAGDRPHHNRVMRAALSLFTETTPPGKVVSKET